MTNPLTPAEVAVLLVDHAPLTLKYSGGGSTHYCECGELYPCTARRLAAEWEAMRERIAGLEHERDSWMWHAQAWQQENERMKANIRIISTDSTTTTGRLPTMTERLSAADVDVAQLVQGHQPNTGQNWATPGGGYSHRCLECREYWPCLPYRLATMLQSVASERDVCRMDLQKTATELAAAREMADTYIRGAIARGLHTPEAIKGEFMGVLDGFFPEWIEDETQMWKRIPWAQPNDETVALIDAARQASAASDVAELDADDDPSLVDMPPVRVERWGMRRADVSTVSNDVSHAQEGE